MDARAIEKVMRQAFDKSDFCVDTLKRGKAWSLWINMLARPKGDWACELRDKLGVNPTRDSKLRNYWVLEYEPNV